MNTRHVPDLELCQEFDRLWKEKGIVMPWTEYVWVPNTETGGLLTHPGVGYGLHKNIGKWKCAVLPAPLVSEQGEWLPGDREFAFYSGGKNKGLWHFGFAGMYLRKGEEMDRTPINATTEANARQKMLNHLIAEGIITKL